jgi:transposase
VLTIRANGDRRRKRRLTVLDIRDKVLKAVEGGMCCQQAAAHYGVSPTTVLKWTQNASIAFVDGLDLKAAGFERVEGRAAERDRKVT